MHVSESVHKEILHAKLLIAWVRLALFLGHVGGEKMVWYQLLVHVTIVRKNWEPFYIWNLSVKSICIHPIHLCIIKRQEVRQCFLMHVNL